MKTINIDFELYKHLTMMRESEEDTYNDVIRRLADLDEVDQKKRNTGLEKEPFVAKGVSFPHGTKFKSTYKGKNYFAKVEDGSLIYNGESHTSPSSAAIAVTGNSVNGWTFWECQFPGDNKWRNINQLR